MTIEGGEEEGIALKDSDYVNQIVSWRHVGKLPKCFSSFLSQSTYFTHGPFVRAGIPDEQKIIIARSTSRSLDTLRRARTLFLADSCSAHKPPAAITSVIFRVPSQTTLIQTSHAVR